jgi:L-arabinose isomerase
MSPTIGLLPLYLELYDRLLPACRPRVEAFAGRIRRAFEARGVRVVPAPVCRRRAEFERAVRSFETASVDAVVTLHLAYSPSLESAAALARTRLPLIVLDTTPTFAFGPGQDPAAIMDNHGIHGVQDLCNLLIRRGKPFRIEAGHWERSDVIDRVIRLLPAARMARALATARVGLVGTPFAGMGDFSVPAAVLRRALGVQVIASKPAQMRRRVRAFTAHEVGLAMVADTRRFDVGGLDILAHERSVRTGLAVRRWIADEKLTALSMNFESAGTASGLPVMPFLEISKAMARGIGYAGEGDVLTAALVGALAAGCPATTFTEMFCPDWQGGRVFLSHMGEFNLDLADGRPQLAEPGVNFTPAAAPVVAYARLKGGRALFVNLAPLPRGTFRLIVAPGAMLSVRGADRFTQSVRGWFKPALPLPDFLAEYSRLGGTHHAALVYGGAPATLQAFGEFAKLDVKVLA